MMHPNNLLPRAAILLAVFLPMQLPAIASVLSGQDVVVPGDFANHTGDAVFDHSLRQALRAALDESPWLNVLSDASMVAGLKKLTSPPETPWPAQVVSQLCRNMHGAAFIPGTIDRAGSAFVITLQLENCTDDKMLVEVQRTAADQAHVVDALGEAVTELRLKAGEPYESVRKFSTPLSQATSSSLPALRQWSLGIHTWRKDGAVAATPFFSRAIELDPGFADAIYTLGICYRNAGEEARARGLFIRAFELRRRAGIRKRLAIAGIYYAFVTVDDQKAIAAYTKWIESYPRDEKAVSNLGSFYGDICRYEEAIAYFKKAAQMDPGDVAARENQVELLPALGKFAEARSVYEEMLRDGLDDDSPHVNMYTIAFHQHDAKEMAQQVAWFDAHPDLRHEILSEQADAAAYGGQMAHARNFTQKAVQTALENDNKEQAAVWLLNGAWREELFGNRPLAHDEAVRAFDMAPDSREGAAMAAILLARTGDVGRAGTILSELGKRYPDHSVVQSYWLPCIRAQIALQKNDMASALSELRKASPLDMLYPQVMFYSHMPSVVLRAEAYARSGHPAQAEAEWQKVLDHPGIVQLSATAPAARLQLARAYAAQAARGDSSARDKACAAYQEFFSLWQDADPGMLIFQDAHAEYAKLKERFR